MNIDQLENLFLTPILQKMSDGKPYKRCDMKTFLNPTIKGMIKAFEKENNVNIIGELRLEDRIGWAFTHLIKAEYIEKNGGKYQITEEGETALKDITKTKKRLNYKYLEENSENYLKNWNS